MKSGINLTLTRPPSDSAAQKIMVGSVVIFSIAVLLAAAVLAYRFSIQLQVTNLIDEEQSLNSQLNAMATKRDQYKITKDRLEDIQTVLAMRDGVNARIDTATEIVPAGSDIDDVGGTLEEVSFEVTSPDLASMNTMMEQKISEIASDKKKGIQTIELQTFNLDTSTKTYRGLFKVTFAK